MSEKVPTRGSAFPAAQKSHPSQLPLDQGVGDSSDDARASNKLTTESEDATPETVADPQPEIPGHLHLEGLKLFLVLGSLTLAVFLMLLDSSVVATAIPEITGEFQSLDDIGWYGTAYLMGNCAFQPLSGKIYSYFNVKWTFVSFFAIFEIGSVLCGAATSSAMLIVGRAVAGLGSSGILNGGYTILALLVPVSKQALYRGVLTGLSFFGLLAGPLIGGALTEYTTWRWCFYLNLPCGAAVALGLFLTAVPNYRVVDNDGSMSTLQRLRKLDLVGFVLFTPTVIMFILALQWGGTRYRWDSAVIIGLFCGSFGNLLLFLGWEYYRGAEAMIPLFLIRRRIIWSSCLNMAFFIGCTLTNAYYFPVYFQAVRDASPAQSGVDMLPQIITTMIASIVAGGLIGRLGYYLPFALASGVFTSIGTGLVATLTPNSPTSRRIGFQILQGLQGLGFQVPIIAVQNGVRKEEVSVANALVVFSQTLSGAVFLSLAQVIFSNRLRHFLSVYAPTADAAALIAAGAAATDLKAAVPADLLSSVRLAYSDTFDEVMYLGTGAACAAFVFATGMGWVRINANSKPEV